MVDAHKIKKGTDGGVLTVLYFPALLILSGKSQKRI